MTYKLDQYRYVLWDWYSYIGDVAWLLDVFKALSGRLVCTDSYERLYISTQILLGTPNSCKELRLAF